MPWQGRRLFPLHRPGVWPLVCRALCRLRPVFRQPLGVHCHRLIFYEKFEFCRHSEGAAHSVVFAGQVVRALREVVTFKGKVFKSTGGRPKVRRAVARVLSFILFCQAARQSRAALDQLDGLPVPEAAPVVAAPACPFPAPPSQPPLRHRVVAKSRKAIVQIVCIDEDGCNNSFDRIVAETQYTGKEVQEQKKSSKKQMC